MYIISVAALDSYVWLSLTPYLANIFHARIDESSFFMWWLIGAGVMSFVAGYISDTIGRKNTLIASAIILLASSVMGLFAQSWNIFLISRLLQGLGSSGTQSVSTTLLHDYSSNGQYKIGYSAVSYLFAKVVGVILGAMVALVYWRDNYILLTIMDMAVIWLTWKFVPYKPMLHDSVSMKHLFFILLVCSWGVWVSMSHGKWAWISGGISAVLLWAYKSHHKRNSEIWSRISIAAFPAAVSGVALAFMNVWVPIHLEWTDHFHIIASSLLLSLSFVCMEVSFLFISRNYAHWGDLNLQKISRSGAVWVSIVTFLNMILILKTAYNVYTMSILLMSLGVLMGILFYQSTRLFSGGHESQNFSYKSTMISTSFFIRCMTAVAFLEWMQSYRLQHMSWLSALWHSPSILMWVGIPLVLLVSSRVSLS